MRARQDSPCCGINKVRQQREANPVNLARGSDLDTIQSKVLVEIVVFTAALSHENGVNQNKQIKRHPQQNGRWSFLLQETNNSGAGLTHTLSLMQA